MRGHGTFEAAVKSAGAQGRDPGGDRVDRYQPRWQRRQIGINTHAQTRLFTEAIKKAGVDPRSISYVESAANGSPMRDVLELSALSRAFREFTPDLQFCAVGSCRA